jgi:hypothetical protein
MKEVLTKKFWEEVKKTFDEAKEGQPGKSGDAQVPAEGQPNDVGQPSDAGQPNDLSPPNDVVPPSHVGPRKDDSSPEPPPPAEGLNTTPDTEESSRSGKPGTP